jgi:hypothetical protein
LHPFRLWGRYEEVDWSSVYLSWTMVLDLVLHFILWLLTCDFYYDFRYVVNELYEYLVSSNEAPTLYIQQCVVSMCRCQCRI